MTESLKFSVTRKDVLFSNISTFGVLSQYLAICPLKIKNVTESRKLKQNKYLQPKSVKNPWKSGKK
jgi:hypothetical protein